MLAVFALVARADWPQPPEVAARSWMLLDASSGQVLAAHEPDAPVEPASLTKLMTAYLVFDALRAGRITLQQTMSVSERAWRMPGSRMFIEPRMQVPVEDLIKGMIVQSGNDATVALAEGLAGSVERFVALMNQQAQALGMQATRYRNPEGLTEPGHQTTARDLATLAQRLVQDFPQYVTYYAIKRYRYTGTPAANDANRNLLLWRDPTVDGLKTGYTDAAGYCLIATARRQQGQVGERRLIAVVLGAASESTRANEAQKLLNWGFAAWEPVRLFDADQAVVSPAVWKGRAATVGLGSPAPVIVAVPSGAAARVGTRVVRPEPLVAPLLKGQAVARLEIVLDDKPLATVPLQVLETVAEAGVLGRAWDALRLWIR